MNSQECGKPNNGNHRKYLILSPFKKSISCAQLAGEINLKMMRAEREQGKNRLKDERRQICCTLGPSMLAFSSVLLSHEDVYMLESGGRQEERPTFERTGIRKETGLFFSPRKPCRNNMCHCKSRVCG